MFLDQLGDESTKLLTLELMRDGASNKSRKSTGTDASAHGDCEGARDTNGDFLGRLDHAEFIL